MDGSNLLRPLIIIEQRSTSDYTAFVSWFRQGDGQRIGNGNGNGGNSSEKERVQALLKGIQASGKTALSYDVVIMPDLNARLKLKQSFCE